MKKEDGLVIANNAAVFPWGFMLVWMTLLSVMTIVALRGEASLDSPLPGSVPFILGLFWLGGLGATWWAFRQPRVRLTIDDGGGIVLSRMGPLWREHWRGRPGDLRDVRLVEEKDSDGDPYFLAVVRFPFGDVKVAEGHQREQIETTVSCIQARLRAAIGQDASRE